MSIERPAIRYARGYRITIESLADNGEVIASRTEDYRSYDEARKRFDYHKTYITISRAHKLKVGVPKEAEKIYLQLWDKGERYELAEEWLAA